MATALYKRSNLFGRYYVIDEGISELPVIRVAFVIITIILGVSVLLKLTVHLLSTSRNRHPNSKQPEENLFLLHSVFLLYFISYAIHIIHYVDNIYRPVDYLEPRWLYVKYLVSEMELTFFANFPISIMGLMGVSGLITAIHEENAPLARQNCKRLTFYILGSLLTLGHYLTELPSHYSAFVNFTIAGEGIVTFLFALSLGFTCWKRFGFKDSTARLTPVIEYEDTVKLLEFFEDQQETQDTRDYSKTRRRSRSRTPVKTTAKL